jgi:hypothetical protein
MRTLKVSVDERLIAIKAAESPVELIKAAVFSCWLSGDVPVLFHPG